MIDFFTWFGSLDPLAAWGIGVLLALILAIIPYFGLIKTYLRIKFSNQTPEIVEFSWRLIPDQLVGKTFDSSLYFSSQGATMLYEGMVILLTWKVIGTYSVDLEPLGTGLKGNSVYVVIKRGNNQFTLIAHTPKGKLSQEIVIRADAIKILKTFNLSKEKHFGQDNDKLETFPISSSKYRGWKYTEMKWRQLPKIFFSRIFYKETRFKPNNSKLVYDSPFKLEKQTIKVFIEGQPLIKTYQFKPGKYNQAINENQINQTS
jgi:hypothetical protein